MGHRPALTPNLADVPELKENLTENCLVRPLGQNDLPALTELINTLAAHDGSPDRQTEPELRDQLEAAGFVLADDSRVAATPAGTLAGWAIVPTPPAGGYLLHCLGGVRPESRGTGIGRQLLGWQLERAAELWAAAGDTRPWQFHVGVPADDQQTERLCARFGLAPVRYWFEMERPVADPSPAAILPEGLEIVPYEDRHEGSLYRAHTVAFAGHFGFQDRTQEEWRSRLQTQNLRPGQSVVAVDSAGEVVSYVISYGSAIDPTRMLMGGIGTRPEWRRKGVASALIAAGFTAYRKAGVQTARLEVDSSNSTGAVGVYERMGFRVVRRSTTFGRLIGS